MGKFSDSIGDAAGGILGGVVGTGMGLLLEGHNDRRQLEQQKKLQEQQIKGQKEMADYQQGLQMKMWKDTNYGAQKEELKAAGLNPGLIYGMSGGGGATTGSASGAGVAGAQAPVGGGEVQGMGMQSAMMAAQLKLMEAQANKTNVEAQNIGGVQKDNIIASTNNLTETTKLIGEQVKSQTVMRNGMELDNIFKGIQNDIQSATASSQIKFQTAEANAAEAKVDQILSEIEGQNIDNEIKRKAKEDIIASYNASVKNIMVDTILKATQGRLNETQANGIVEQIGISWRGLEQDQQKNQWGHEDKLKDIAASIENTGTISKAMIYSAGLGATGNISRELAEWGKRLKTKPNIGFPIGGKK